MHLILDSKLFLAEQVTRIINRGEVLIEAPNKVEDNFQVKGSHTPYLLSKKKTSHKNILNTPLIRNNRLRDKSKTAKNTLKLPESQNVKPLNLLTSSKGKEKTLSSSLSFYNIFDINFIKRERLYTKLKYSRSPAYDIVSGGAAAFLAAFIGFLVSEKFGIELVDSGDFYTAFMYSVFIGLSFKPFMKILQFSRSLTSSFINKLKIIILTFMPSPKKLISIL
jgi:hypothetical protein